jgi:hypothetical protein
MVDRKNISRLSDEGFVLRGNFGEHDARLGVVGEPAGVEAILQ